MGCLLTPTYILTARHVWAEVSHQYSWPTVLKFDGIFRCEVAFESAESDILVLRATTKLDDAPLRAPTAYPIISDSMLSIGASVGIVSALHLLAPGNETKRFTAFAGGYVAFMQPFEAGAAASYALSGCVVQKGMSGSPAFRPDGSLVGVFIQTISFRADFLDPHAPLYTLPVISPLLPLRSQIRAVISQ